MDETEIIRKLKQGDIESLALLVRGYQEKALRTAYLITYDRALAQDVVQESFLHAYERIEQFETGRPFGPWFLRIVANRAIQMTRRRKRELSLEQPTGEGLSLAGLLADRAPAPDDQVAWQERQEQIEAALRRLSPRQRAAIVMRYYLDYSEEEMAQALQRPAGTVKSRLYHARNRLKGMLQWEILSSPEGERPS